MTGSAAPAAVTPKQFVLEYFEDVIAKRWAEASARMAPDAIFWVPGGGRWPFGGTHDPVALQRLFKLAGDRFPDGISMKVRGITAEGERVCVEVDGYAKRTDGRIYEPRYHYLFIVRDGLIHERYEYVDTLHANDLLCGPLDE